MAQLRSDIAATAELQAASPFFNKLPFEIREKIFDELWALHDTRWHVHSAGDHAVPVFPCITGPDEEDTRYSHFQTSRGSDALAWESRLRSPWNTHWRCAEAAAARATNPRTGRTASPRDYIRRRPSFATSSSPLLVCKRWYLESVEALENALTFCFTDIIVARDFLSMNAPTRNIRNIEISLRVKPLITELYFPGPDGEPQPHIAGVPVTAKDNPWEDLCRRLSAIPNLRELHIYLDSEDLRPWHKRVNERSFLKQLLQAGARHYVLYLPNIPGEAGLQGLPGTYLEDDLLHKAPCAVVRGPRPNNWQLHLSRISHVLPENWTHTLWNQARDRVMPQYA
ncbi:hypothetical protein N8I77_000147 [Diaporthe amygdali]|uniref:DUF7730 domain-containing protein n=1 Tax=Phomopsis amygdali TaxID=1214568 RepID=A0AAD9SPF9_PHOAM|nr:hypothetical protein N8I77_000147 [Diaporthe amygdali]